MSNWIHIYVCPRCGSTSDVWQKMCPCWDCGRDNDEKSLTKRVGKVVWKPTWRNWFRRQAEFKEE